MSYLLDSGFIYAQLNGKDRWHAQVSSVITVAEKESITLPVPAVTEVSYLLQHDLGVGRTAEIFHKYNDNKIDFVDACIVAMAERLNITKILTVDRRHFQIFRPDHCEAFEIFP